MLGRLQYEAASLFSIIIPAYEVAQYINECIDSVCHQATSYEVICINDESLDKSGALLDEKARYSKCIRVLHQRNRGVSITRNRGLEYLQGDYFLFLDGDDILLAGALKAIKNIIQQYTSDLYVFPSFLQHEKFEQGIIMFGQAEARVLSKRVEKLELICKDTEVQGRICGRVYRSQAFHTLRFPIGLSFMEDQWFWMNALFNANQIIISSLCYYGYRVRDGSATRQQTTLQSISAIKVGFETFSIIKSLGGTKRDFSLFWKRKASCIKSSIRFLIHRWSKLSVNDRECFNSTLRRMRILTGFNPLSLLLRFRLWVMCHASGGMKPSSVYSGYYGVA